MKDKLKTFIPLYGYFPIITLFAFNSLVYFLTKLVYDPARAYDLSLGIDHALPFVPALILFYILFVESHPLHEFVFKSGVAHLNIVAEIDFFFD